MTSDPRSDGELLAGLARQPELMGVLDERHAPAVFRYLARRAGPPAAEDLLSAPAMRVALLADAEKISGVSVVGKYTDSLGRTGIALRQGSAETQVIDTSNGQVLTDIQPTPAHQGCTTFKYPTFSVGKDGKRLGPTTYSTGISCDFGGATLFLSADATNTEPHVNQQPTPLPSSGLAPSA